MDALQSLVQKSLVRQATDDRFDLLVSVQEYAAEHLRTAGRYTGSGPTALLAAETRHGAYFASLDEKTAIDYACVELDNFVAACRRAAARGDADMAASTLEGAWAGLSLRGPFRVGIELACLVQAIPGLQPRRPPGCIGLPDRALEVPGRARTRMCSSSRRSREPARLATTLRVPRAYGPRRPLSHAGRMESALAYVEAALHRRRTERSDAAERGQQRPRYRESFLGRPSRLSRIYAKALALAREARDRLREGRILANLGILHIEPGIMDKARSHDEAAIVAAREIGNRRLEGNTLCNLGLLHQVQGSFAEALEQLEAALAVARDIGMPTSRASCCATSE